MLGALHGCVHAPHTLHTMSKKIVCLIIAFFGEEKANLVSILIVCYGRRSPMIVFLYLCGARPGYSQLSFSDQA